jgi:transcriptional regulator with XRE-family HTH domain
MNKQTANTKSGQTIGERLTVARTSANVTFAKLSTLTGFAVSTLCDSEKSRMVPSFRLLVAVCDALNCDLAWLQTGKGTMRVSPIHSLVARAGKLLQELEHQAAGVHPDPDGQFAQAINELRSGVQKLSRYDALFEHAKANVREEQSGNRLRKKTILA